MIAQLGQSLDGRIATTSGESKYINGPHALDHLHALRAEVDAVVVGAGTVAADDPWLSVRRVPGRSPARVVLDPSGRVDPAARCFRPDGARRVVVRRQGTRSPLAEGVEELPLGPDGAFAPSMILSALAGQGFARILVEGGPRTLAAFLDAGCVDVLHVFVSPVILGAGRIGLERKECENLADALRPPTRVHVFPDGDVLFECDLRRAGVRQREALQGERETTPDDAQPSQPRDTPLRATG
ncbi:RibD family protein [Xanthobacter sp. AM11]|uniref:RibD family protein n=1 Tax=Xanthobacter sp. AM11 TaxID=3380643 RepID=UPI0039BEDE10